MSLEVAIAIARELLTLSSAAISEPRTANRNTPLHEEVDELLTKREALVWRLRSACSVDVLSGAAPADREVLAALLRGAVEFDERVISRIDRERDRVLGALASAARSARAGEPIEPRLTERVA